MQLRAPLSDTERGVPNSLVRAYSAAVVDVRASEGVWSCWAQKMSEQREQVRFPKGVQSVTVVTAYNPRGEKRPEHLNVAAQQALMSRLKGAGVLRLGAIIRGADSTWAEPAVGMCDVPLEQAIAVSRNCQQAAFLHWTPGVLSLVWTPTSQIITADHRVVRTSLKAD